MGLQGGTDVKQIGRGLAGLARPEHRRAFLRTVRTNLDLKGQMVSARDRLYLAEHLPTLIIWGARDRIIPLRHGTAAHRAIPGSELHVLDDAGHFPHLDEPDEVAGVIAGFIQRTEAADVPRERWGQILRDGPPRGTAGEPTAAAR